MQYLNICNEAMKEHKDEFPYKEIINVSESIWRDKPIDLAVYNDSPVGVFSVKLKDKKLTKNISKSDYKKSWRVDLSYLEKVVQNPQDYIDHPEKLDLDWVKSRLGLL